VVSKADGVRGAVPLALNLELNHARHGASARVELRERSGETTALLQVRGWLERIAVERLSRTLDDLAARGVRRLHLDCSRLHDIESRQVPALIEALARFERQSGRILVDGLSHHLLDLLRLAGCEGRLAPAPAESQDPPEPLRRTREWAS